MSRLLGMDSCSATLNAAIKHSTWRLRDRIPDRLAHDSHISTDSRRRSPSSLPFLLPRLAALTAIMTIGLWVVPLAMVGAQSQISANGPIPLNQPNSPAGGPAVTLLQRAPDWFDFQVRQGELRARLALHFKEKSLTFYPDKRPGARALEWPLFTDMAGLLRAALQAALADAGKMPAFSFSVRLVMYPEMSYRVALHAVASKKWNTSSGRPRAAFMNSFIVNVANENETYPELKELFGAMGYRIDLVSLEKVLAVQARDLPYHVELLAQGVGERSRVPYDAILWFKVQRSN